MSRIKDGRVHCKYLGWQGLKASLYENKQILIRARRRHQNTLSNCISYNYTRQDGYMITLLLNILLFPIMIC
jgi:hypothetical protein